MSSRFHRSATSIEGLSVLQAMPIGDQRGWLERLFCLEEMADLLDARRIVQVNRTFTQRRGTVRGMHYQRPPHAEMKLVLCLRGEVFDVAVDIRPDSATCHAWHGEILSGDNHKMLAIPEGFAHGFQTMTDDTEMLYFHTKSYQPSAEGGLNPRDPRLAITWPMAISEISLRDDSHPLVR